MDRLSYFVGQLLRAQYPPDKAVALARQTICILEHAPTGPLQIPVSDLDITVRVEHVLYNLKIDRLWQIALCKEQDLLKTKNMGRKSVRELRDLLTSYNLRFGMTLDTLREIDPSVGTT